MRAWHGMRKIRQYGNCLTVALLLWAATRGRGWFWFRRSQGLGGKVPHFGHARERPNGRLMVIDGIPPRRKATVCDEGDSFLCFPVTIRAREYRLVAQGTGDTIRDAVRGMWSRSPCRHCGRT